MINFYTNQYNHLKTYMNLMNRMYTPQIPSNQLIPSQQQTYSLYHVQRQSMLDNLYTISKDITNLKQSSHTLLMDNSTSSLHARKITTSNDTSIDASVKNGATIKDYSLQINQIAKSQENQGNQLNQNDTTSIMSGENQFSLTVGSETKTLSVSILSTDTNENALQKVADAINQSGLDITAEIAKDNNSNQVQLQVMSNNTGTNSSFSFTEVSGNVITETGINNRTTQAQNAEYYIDGNLNTSQSNSIKLDQDKVTFTLKAVTSHEETVSITPDKKEIINQTKQMVGDYNQLLDTFNRNANILSPAIRKHLSSELYSYHFDHTGISKSGSDQLYLNEKDLDQQLEINFKTTVNSIDRLADKLYDKSNHLGGMSGEMILQKNTYQDSLQHINYYPFMNVQRTPYSWYTGWIFDRYF